MRSALGGCVAGLCAALAVVTAAPVAAADHDAAFKAPALEGPKPWTSERFDDAPDKFTFAVVTDLESGYRKGVFDVAIAELGLLRPAFVITVGDLIEGGSEDEAK